MSTLALPDDLTPVLDAPSPSPSYDGVYLVGGTVRDILLGEPNFDVDLARSPPPRLRTGLAL